MKAAGRAGQQHPDPNPNPAAGCLRQPRLTEAQNVPTGATQASASPSASAPASSVPASGCRRVCGALPSGRFWAGPSANSSLLLRKAQPGTSPAAPWPLSAKAIGAATCGVTVGASAVAAAGITCGGALRNGCSCWPRGGMLPLGPDSRRGRFEPLSVPPSASTTQLQPASSGGRSFHISSSVEKGTSASLLRMMDPGCVRVAQSDFY
jgi:hypothetical protein